MKTLLALVAPIFLLSGSANASERTREVQTELKAEGFYYGEVNGQDGPETSAAIRRFQIRHGLEVTGSLNAETLASLGVVGSSPAPATRTPAAPARPAPPATREPTKAKPPVNLRRDETVEESDRAFLRRNEAPRQPAPPINDPSVIAPPASIPEPTADFSEVFADTPYTNAPFEVQSQTLRRAQSLLASRGHYREVVDGIPGPATEEALLSFQRGSRLPLTGRLDLETLSQLRLLPSRPSLGRSFGSSEPRRSSRTQVFRGIWVE